MRHRRRAVHVVQTGSGLQRHGLRVQCAVMPEWLLRQQPGMPGHRHGHRTMWQGRHGLHELRRRDGLQRRRLYVYRRFVHRRLLQRHRLRALRQPDERAMWRERRLRTVRRRYDVQHVDRSLRMQPVDMLDGLLRRQ
jgi:hypothetical protein